MRESKRGKYLNIDYIRSKSITINFLNTSRKPGKNEKNV